MTSFRGAGMTKLGAGVDNELVGSAPHQCRSADVVWTARCRDADREKGRASWCQVGLPARSLPRRRFRRTLRAFICIFCMRVCIIVYVCICADMIYVYICMCVCICTSTRLYTCVCVCVCIFVHRLWVLVSVLQRVDGVMHAHVFSCTYACVYICV